MARSGKFDYGWLLAPFIWIGVPVAFYLGDAIADGFRGGGEHVGLSFVLGLGILTGVPALFVAGVKYSNAIKAKRQEEARRVARCKHGVTGAVYEPARCRECGREREREEMLRKFAAEQSERAAKDKAAQRERERQERHREFVRKIRLPEHLRSMPPAEFEHLVCDLFRRLGYEAETTPISGDRGVDGYLRRDGALSVLQCKRVKGSVGEPVLRDLFGTMHGLGAVEGIVVTTGKVTHHARDWAKGKPIRIIELEELTTLIRRHYKENEVVPEEFQPKATPPDLCPTCGKPLRIVNGRRGKFLGCTGYPDCKYTRPLGTPRHWRR